MTEKETEAQLVARAKDGDEKALSSLVTKYKDRLFGIASGLCVRMPSETEDVAQEALLSALKNIKTFKANAAFSTWLYRIAANNCWQRMRSAKRHPSEELPDENSKNHPSTSCVNENAIKNELSQAVSKALNTLPPQQRMAIMLCDIEDLQLAQAAKQMGITLPALKSRLHRARQALTKQLKDFK